jgi:hypothetical protein
VNADPAAQLRLLDLQAVDTVLAQLVHRRGRLPELADIARADERLADLQADTVRAETEVSDLDREQKRVDRDVEQVRNRAQRDRGRMDSGSVGSAKELESLQHEVATLARRQSTLEDQELEVMERREESESRLAEVRAEAERVGAERAEAVGRRDTAYEQIDAETATHDAERTSLVLDIPEALLTLYEKVRAQAGGTGAAALRARRCEGCRLELAGTELTAARNAAPDLVLRCEECRRILVRTPDSGL